ncbi:MAG: glycosyltransferase family 4 protein [Candidatus Krumholzibacteriales bacterium]
MKILIALSFSPWPVTRGTDRLIVNLLRGLSRRHQVKLVTMVLERKGISALRELEGDGITVEAMLAPQRKSVFHRVTLKFWNLLRSAVMRIPVQTLYAAPTSYLNLVAGTARNWNPDLTIVNYWHLWELAEMLGGSEKALLTHDLDFMNYPERIRAENGRVRKMLSGYNFRIKTEAEMKAYRSFDRILTVTGKEAAELEQYLDETGKKIIPLPMAMDLEQFKPEESERPGNFILLMGVFYSDFNRDSLMYFLERIFPKIIGRKPDARLEIVGPGVPEGVADSLYERGVVRGRVDDIAVYLRDCAVMVLPLRFAAGVRIRMLEAAAAGTPVVSTSAGVAGLEIRSGVEYIQADDPDEFSARVVELLEDRQLAVRIGMGARKWAEENISLSSYPDRLDAVLERLME